MIERYKVTDGQFVPTHFVRMLKLPDAVRAKYDVSSLKCAIHAAAPCPVPVKQAMIAWWGPVLFEYYAGTEGQVFFEPTDPSSAPFEYHNDPAKTAESRNKHGWTSLGDVGMMDAEGYLYLTDRKSFMIISGGVNIYPQEIENLLVTHPKVTDCAVFGVPNEDFGEEVKAVVQPVSMEEAGPALAEELLEIGRAHV